MILWWWWAACGGDCGETCPLGTTCDAGECVQRRCATSAQCALGHTCSEDGACVEGCAADADCPVGATCAQGRCEALPCTVTAIDCGWREECRAGVCEDVGEPYCRPCTDDAQCGAGNTCWAGEWCGVPCGAGGACPAGFACLAVEQEGGTVDLCLSACWLEVAAE
jgi:Cys-rich repeat protein